VQVVILSARTGWHTSELCRALSARGHVSVVLPYEALVATFGAGSAGLSSEGAAILEADAVFARIIPSGTLEQIIFRVDALHWIEERGVPVVNSPRAIERAVDKFYTDALLREAGVPTPETVVCGTMADAMDAVRRFGDAVMKSLDQVRSVFYLQRYIDHGGRDVRVFVVGGRVLGAIERRAAAGDWRTNVARGAEARAFDLPVEWARLALRAAAAIGADYAGVDLLPAADGRVFVLEVNGIPGWQGLQRATGLDVAGALVDHLETRVGGDDVRREKSEVRRE
jgi:glutathione synthase/RimK-type ligase-like ATP-grasp enzyme